METLSKFLRPDDWQLIEWIKNCIKTQTYFPNFRSFKVALTNMLTEEYKCYEYLYDNEKK